LLNHIYFTKTNFFSIAHMDFISANCSNFGCCNCLDVIFRVYILSQSRINPNITICAFTETNKHCVIVMFCSILCSDNVQHLNTIKVFDLYSLCIVTMQKCVEVKPRITTNNLTSFTLLNNMGFLNLH
jgi:hypothetical protein